MPKYIPHSEAARILTDADRILVVRCSGGGKTTLSQKIAKKFDMNYQSIDRDVRWLPGWKEREKQKQRAIITRLVLHDRWVMDGSSPSTFDLRLPRTDLILWVRVPRYVALMGLVKRVTRYYGLVRPEMTEGCPEPLPDREFLSYIWNFEKKSTPIFIRNIDQYGPNVPVAIPRSHGEMFSLLQLSLYP